jgi:hypothetical protein
VAAGAMALCACASKSEDIEAQYVSPLNYQHYSCDQLAQEGACVSRRAAELAGAVDNTAKDDAVLTGVGVVLFWPALLFLEGDGPQAAEYARLKGERDAIEQAAIEKNCEIRFEEAES